MCNGGARPSFFSFPSFLWICTLIYLKPTFIACGLLLKELQLTVAPNLVLCPLRKPYWFSLCYSAFIFLVTTCFRFIAERGASRLLEHVGQMDKIFKIPPPPGKRGALSLRPLEENTLSPLPPISQPGSVCVSLPLWIGRGCLQNLKKLRWLKFWLLRCPCLIHWGGFCFPRQELL